MKYGTINEGTPLTGQVKCDLKVWSFMSRLLSLSSLSRFFSKKLIKRFIYIYCCGHS